MVQVTDLVERSTSQSGIDSVVQKKQKLDLSAILAGKPKGGDGASQAPTCCIQRMLKNPDTVTDASELKTHLDLVRLCRTMQPSKIEGMLQADLDKGLSALEKAGVPLPAFSKTALLRRRTKQLRLATEKAPTDENVFTFKDCTIPWRCGEEAPFHVHLRSERLREGSHTRDSQES